MQMSDFLFMFVKFYWIVCKVWEIYVDFEWMQFTESIVATSRWKSMEYATLHVLLEHYDISWSSQQNQYTY